MSSESLLFEIAETLWEQAQRHARPVIETGQQDAAQDRFVGAYAFSQYQQGATSSALFHLPEPVLNPRDRPRVVVVGVNPGFGIGERMPTLEWTLEDYVAFYWNRFGRDNRKSGYPAVLRTPPNLPLRELELYQIPHLRKVEDILTTALGPQALDGQAVYCDAIPWKFNNKDKSLRPILSLKDWKTVWDDHAPNRISRVASVLNPEVILILGEFNAKRWQLKLSNGPFTRRNVRIGDWSGTVVSSLHPNARSNQFSSGFDTHYRTAVAWALRESLS